MLRIITIIIVILGYTQVVFSQKNNYVVTNPEENDSIIYSLNNYSDYIQWQKSYSGTEWYDIQGENGDSLILISTENIFIRAKICADNCTTFSSQSIVKLGELVQDIDGNLYKTVQIGDQVWMAENLRVTHYPDGTPIPNPDRDVNWTELGNSSFSDAYRWYDSDSANHAYKYGALYTWAAVMNNEPSSQNKPSGVQGVCPDGWHVPSSWEWFEVFSLGEKLKDSIGWNNDGNGTNETGFSALPGGKYGSSFYHLGNAGYWSSSSVEYFGDTNYIRYFYMHYSGDQEPTEGIEKTDYLSVRCVEDDGSPLNSPPNKPEILSPVNEATDVQSFDTLKWTCTDPESEPLRYDIYLDTLDASTLVSSNQLDSFYILPSLENNKIYYWKIVASDTNLNKTTGDMWSYTTASGPSFDYGLGIDIDGNIYKTIEIGEKVWMAENLRTTHYSDGTLIPNVSIDSLWGELNGNYDKAYSWYLNDSVNYFYYGAYYTWPAAVNGDTSISSATNPSNLQGVCPTGWHLPSRLEFLELLDYLDTTAAGGQTAYALKSTSGWKDEGNGSNESGFNAYPYGYRNYGGFHNITETGFWWSSEKYGAWSDNFIYSDAFAYVLALWNTNNDGPGAGLNSCYYCWNVRSNGYNVRCVQDETISDSIPPEKPELLFPENGNTETEIFDTLKWYCPNPDDEQIRFVVYLDTIDADSPVSSSLTDSVYEMTNLIADKTYYWKIVALDSVGNISTSDVYSFTTKPPNTFDYYSLQDIDGNDYKAVEIGSQVWMAENLRVTRYADGTLIPKVSEDSIWKDLDVDTAKAYCWYNNDSINNFSNGIYYSWPAAVNGDTSNSSSSNPSNVQGICPTGWHLPSPSEWLGLLAYVDTTSAGGRTAFALKSRTGWTNDGNGSNESGFNGFPFGYRSNDSGVVNNTYSGGYWWSSESYGTFNASSVYCDSFAYNLEIRSTDVAQITLDSVTYDNASFRSNGINVRCLKDEETPLVPYVDKPKYVYPLNGSGNIDTNITLTWEPSDPDKSVLYNVYFDTLEGNTLIADSVQNPYYTLSKLDFEKTYLWKIVEFDESGSEVSGTLWSFTTRPDGYISDYDGNIYNIVLIGDLLWMAENLRTTHYSDGTPIPKIESNEDWALLGNNSTDAAYCWNDNDSVSYSSPYGALYTWAAVMYGDSTTDVSSERVQGVCPSGWFVPKIEDWYEIFPLGEALKDSTGWLNDGNGTNDYGFSALPGGERVSGGFFLFGSAGYWSSSTETDWAQDQILYFYMHSSGDMEPTDIVNKSKGISVRCVKPAP